MFLMHLCFQHSQYTLSTKRNTIQRFEKHTAMKERQLMKAEKKLEDDAIAFEEFLRENDQRSVDALKMFVSPYCPPHPRFGQIAFYPLLSSFQFFRTQPNTKQTNKSVPFQCSSGNYKQTANDGGTQEGEFGDPVCEKVRLGLSSTHHLSLPPLKPTGAWQDLRGTNPDQLVIS